MNDIDAAAKRFNDLSLKDRLDIMQVCSEFLFRIKTNYYTVWIFHIQDNIVIQTYNNESGNLIEIAMLYYQELDTVISDITLPFNYKVKKI